MKKVAFLCLVALVMLGMALMVATQATADDKKPKEISTIMKEAHKSGLLKKVTKGEGSKEDKEKLLALYVDLSKNTPPKGEKEAWAKRTGAIVKAAKAVAKGGDKKALARLKRATSCGACHKIHKP